ncbi:Methylthioribulose-1-phosphate dehydratase [uncultured archaeon]|nr:Methylthioribulose-1-phosphate dehydratase [uncultured archaeon]
MGEEGYIKFNCDFIKAPAIPRAKLEEIIKWRQKFYSLGLIGMYANGIGFGNISVRKENDSQEFIISGSATGGLAQLDENHFTLVIQSEFEKNFLICEGPIVASSESMTHAAIYECDKKANAVIHIHNKAFWEYLLNKVPTTSKDAAYGTPEMAREIFRLFSAQKSWPRKLIAMEGHEEGIISFGASLDEAGKALLDAFNEFNKSKK